MMINDAMLESKWGEFFSLEQLTRHGLQDGRFSILIDEGLFECLLVKKDEPRLFVLLSGARDPEKQSLPKFDRWSWARLFPGSVLCISDPTLYLDPNRLRIGWYVGTENHNWLKSMAALVAHVAKDLGTLQQHVVTYGSSAGGFAALMLAAELRHATAVAINPQTDICKYSERFVNKFLELAFSNRSRSELTPDELDRFSAIKAFSNSPGSKCLLVQNVQDQVHYRKHYAPFCRAFAVPVLGGGDITGRINVMTFDSPNGHGAEPKELFPVFIRRAVDLAALELSRDVHE
jgi:hypothetical protein